MSGKNLTASAWTLIAVSVVLYGLLWPKDIAARLVPISSSDPSFAIYISHGGLYSSESLHLTNAAGLQCVFDGPSYEQIAPVVRRARDIRAQCYRYAGTPVVVAVTADGKDMLLVSESQAYYDLDAARGRVIIWICLALAAALFSVRLLQRVRKGLTCDGPP